jgi:hypothetical protein
MARSVPDFLADICSDPMEHYIGASPSRDLILTTSYWSKSSNRYFGIGASASNVPRIEGIPYETWQLWTSKARFRWLNTCFGRSIQRLCFSRRSWQGGMERANPSSIAICKYAPRAECSVNRLFVEIVISSV